MAVYGFDEAKNKIEVPQKKDTDKTTGNIQTNLSQIEEVSNGNDQILANTLSELGGTFLTIANMATAIKDGDKPTASQIEGIKNAAVCIDDNLKKMGQIKLI